MSVFINPAFARQPITQIAKDNMRVGNDDNLIYLIRHDNKRQISLSRLKKLATKKQKTGFVKAYVATKKARRKHLNITKRDLLTILYFINNHADGRTCYYPKSDTGLSHTVEYDPDTKNYFIVLEGSKVYLDSGAKKTVSKALCYDGRKTRVVARAEQTIPMDLELRVTKYMQGKPGLFKTLGFCSHEKAGTRYYTIYSQLYTPGSLQAIFRNDFKLTFKEKLKIACSLAQGLNTLHKQGLVHRDLGIKNYLITISKGKPGKRIINARIADFGRTNLASEIDIIERIQGNTTYMAPEGHYLSHPQGINYYKTDVFALGCVFYRLVYNEKGPWQKISYVKDPRPLEVRYKEHKKQVLKATAKRRKVLRNKKTLTAKERFEYLVLQMLDLNPKKRIHSKTLYKRLKSIS